MPPCTIGTRLGFRNRCPVESPTNSSPPNKRATKAQTLLRVEEVVRLLLDGATLPDLREVVREEEQKPGVWHLPEGAEPLSDSQLQRYIARAWKAIEDTCRTSRRRLVRRHVVRRRNYAAK